MKTKLEEFLSLVDIYDFQNRYAKDVTEDSYFGFPLESVIESEKRLRSKDTKSLAYLSMEYGLATSFYNTFKKADGIDSKNKAVNCEIFSNMRIEDFLFDFNRDEILDLPLYSGGLGVLAGDILKSTADLGISMAAVGILWEKGYFKQNFWFKYGQVPEEMEWDPYSYPGLIPLNNIIKINFKDDPIYLRLWKYYVYSYDKKNVVPLVLLDSDVEDNSEKIKRLTAQLYRSSDNWIKIMQRLILGVGAIKALDALGCSINKYHLNEGHAAMAFIDKAKNLDKKELADLGKVFVYTCHTPAAAGHDKFPIKDIEKILSDKEISFFKGCCEYKDDSINFTTCLLTHCESINAVSKKHQSIMGVQFPQFKNKINYITNGIHISTWISQSFSELFDKYKEAIGDYRSSPDSLKKIVNLKKDKQFRIDLWNAHQSNKKRLAEIFNHWRIREDVLTICWARRIAQYKRPSLILQNIERLLSITKNIGQLQIIIAGKAHPADNLVGTYIEEMMNTINNLNKEFKFLRIIMLENYDIFFGKLLTSSVDIWLNNPLPPFEASGTSGMKSVLNGVVQLTTLDGWVHEVAHKEIGEIFGYTHKEGEDIGSEGDLKLVDDSEALYNALEKLTRLYYQTYNHGKINPDSRWIDLMINCIAESHYFNSQRAVLEYKEKMWDK